MSKQMEQTRTVEQLELREQVSALVDGQLGGADFASVVDCLGQDEDARASWHLYHVIGDVLRSGEMGSGQHDKAFVARLRERLQAEPGIPRLVEPLSMTPETIATDGHGKQEDRSFDHEFQPAANDRTYRWKVLAGLATVVAVAAVAWNRLDGGGAGVQLARPATPERVEVALGSGGADGGGSAVMIRDPHLDAMLAAHRQFGGGSALQNPAGFLRSATFDGVAGRPMRVTGP